MNHSQIQIADKYFNTVYINTDKYYEMHEEDIDRNDKFYQYYVDLYNYDPNNVKYDASKNFKINYEPLTELYNISKKI